jgi:hypothetical protein
MSRVYLRSDYTTVTKEDDWKKGEQDGERYLYRITSLIRGVDFPTVQINYHKFKILRETPKCYVIREWAGGKEKYVLKNAKKRFAYPTREEAKEGFIARKSRQIRLLNGQLDHAETAMKKVKGESLVKGLLDV